MRGNTAQPIICSYYKPDGNKYNLSHSKTKAVDPYANYRVGGNFLPMTFDNKIFKSKQWLSSSTLQRGVWISLYAINNSLKGTANILITTDLLNTIGVAWETIITTQRNCNLYRIINDDVNKREVRINLFQSKKEEEQQRALLIYNVYPKKVGRPTALRAITKALQNIEFEELLLLTRQFAAARHDQEINYTPHPATWFNQERFHDDQSTWRKEADKPEKPDNDFRI